MNIKVVADLFKRMGVITLWYLGFFALAIIILQIFFGIKAINVDISKVTLVVMSGVSTRFFMLVIGIVFPPIYFAPYMSVGVTRKEFATGLLGVAALLSIGFFVLRLPLLIAQNEFSLLAWITYILYGILTFIIGQISVIGFMYMRFIPIIVGIMCAIAVGLAVILIEKPTFPIGWQLLIVLCAIIICGTGLVKVIGRVPVRG